MAEGRDACSCSIAAASSHTGSHRLQRGGVEGESERSGCRFHGRERERDDRKERKHTRGREAGEAESTMAGDWNWQEIGMQERASFPKG